jgi:hypothetical protein
MLSLLHKHTWLLLLASNAWRAAAVLSFSAHAVTIKDSHAGLYAERVGAINFVLSDSEAAKRVMSQLKRIARALYSNPPVHGGSLLPVYAFRSVSPPAHKRFLCRNNNSDGCACMCERIVLRSPSVEY